MTDIIEHGSNEPEAIRIQTSNSHEVSLKIYQDIYHQITGKTEEIRKSYNDSLTIEFSDIEQLHIKITQLFDVHNVVASNEVISIYYDKDRKEQYTSFDKFRAFNANATSPVSNIEIKYNLSIIPARLTRPQEYVVTIRLSSRVTLLKQLKDDSLPFLPSPIFVGIASETAQIKIEYADYVIARGFLEAFDEWIAGCKKTPEIKFLKSAQKYSHWIPFFGKLLIAILYGYFIYRSIDPIIGKSPGFIVFAKFLLVSSIAFFLAINISNMVFRRIERSIDMYMPISWIKINSGDEKAISEASASIRKNIIMFIVNTIMAIAIGVISSFLYSLIERMT